jgi:ferric-dicitrate binding protein FerR (iron transport regulator)
MSTSVPPRDPGAPAPVPPRSALADEESLRRVFLAEYPTLADKARADLGDEASGLSQKVVEGAFVRAWDARSQIQTPDQLHKFLVDDVHHAAARALSRRAAAHRLGGNDPKHADHHDTDVIDPERSWAHIQHALHGETHSPKALAESAAAARHEAAEHIAIATKEGSLWKAIAVGAALIAILVAGAAWMDRIGSDAKASTAVAAADARVVTSNPGQLGNLILDDGTKVRIAPESKLSIPKAYGTKLRAVKIEGGANFDVAAGQRRPFLVRAGNAIVEAKGTNFTVRAYPADSSVTVVVGAGSVEVRQGKQAQTVPAGKSVFLTGNTMRAASTDERDAADAWRNGTLAVTNRPLRDVLPQLRRWYGLDIHAEQPTLLDRPVSFRASLDSSRQAIRGVESSTGLEFGYMGPNMVFRVPTKKGGKK